MTAAMMLPAPPDGIGQRHRVVAVGSGLGGLTATKALKHSELNITDALVFVTRMTAQGTSRVVNHAPLWVSVAPATAAIAATVSVLIALFVALVSEPTKNIVTQAYYWPTDSNGRGSRPIAKGWL
ncbi:MAG: hypothetical protein JOY55_20185 [Mycobacterium sp.]|nr:hypothetical protein [Mycobacterium sp.]